MTYLATQLCIIFTTVFTINANFYNPECSGFGFSCLDCYTQKLCLGSIIVSNDTCQTGRNTFCDPTDGQCKPKPHPDCEDAGDHKCPRKDGLLPNIKNCSRYIKCTGGVPEDRFCPPRYVFNQLLGKCILKLENSDCIEPKCSFISSVHQYAGDPSLYYQCTGGAPKLLACPENSVYNVTTKRCETVCTGVRLLGNPKNCSEFISCELSGTSYVPIRKSCLAGYGFNAVLGKCQKGLNKLCYEIATFNRDLVNLLELPKFIRDIIAQITKLLSYLDLDYSMLLKYGVPEEFLSTILLVGDYILTHGLKPPPLLVSYIAEFVLLLVPPNLRGAVKLILLFIFGIKL